MAIAEKDIKLLWGRAAGRCSRPGCHEDLTPILEKSGATVLGEMAHVIGRKSSAPRSDPAVGADDTYQNLILLCPTHHTLVDKAPHDFPVDLLGKWKADWESHVAGLDLRISSREELFAEVHRRLVQNAKVHSEWGPTSQRAQAFPQSCQSAARWQMRRVAVLVPNNRLIASLLKANSARLTALEWKQATDFIEHAEFYERHCISPSDASAYLPFPKEFAAMISQGL